VRENNQLVGLAPLYVTHALGTPLRKLAFLGNGITDYMDVLAPLERASEVWTAVLLHTIGTRHFDIFEVQNLCLPAPMWEAINRLRKKDSESLCWSRFEAEASCSVSLPATWQEYLGRLDKIFKSNLMRRNRNVVKTFRPAEPRLANDTELPEVMAALFDLHQQRWNSRQMPGNLKLEKGARIPSSHRCAIPKARLATTTFFTVGRPHSRSAIFFPVSPALLWVSQWFRSEFAPV
jgi:hypothetical protein